MNVPSTEPLHGHLVLVIDRPTEEGAKQDNNKPAPEARFSLREDYESAQGFGVDVDGLAANLELRLSSMASQSAIPSKIFRHFQ